MLARIKRKIKAFFYFSANIVFIFSAFSAFSANSAKQVNNDYGLFYPNEVWILPRKIQTSQKKRG